MRWVFSPSFIRIGQKLRIFYLGTQIFKIAFLIKLRLYFLVFSKVELLNFCFFPILATEEEPEADDEKGPKVDNVQKTLLAASGQDVDAYMKEMEEVHKKTEAEKARITLFTWIPESKMKYYEIIIKEFFFANKTKNSP